MTNKKLAAVYMFNFHAYFYIYSYSMYKKATSVAEGEVGPVKLV